MAVGGVVLAGGLSLRMGQDKARLELEGEALVARAVRRLGEVCAEVVICGGSGLERFGRVIPDDLPGCGPLSGVVAGLTQLNYEWSCVLAVDVPFVPKDAWERLLETVGEEAVAVLPRAGGRVQPLCGLYARRGMDALRGELAAGRWKVMAALAAAGTVRTVEFAEVEWFRNLNTPEEFAAASGL